MYRILLCLFLISVLFSPVQLFAQCSVCFSLEEALKDPARVESLTLRDAGLEAVPKEIGLFTNLKSLDLSYNDIIDFSEPANAGLQEISFNNNYALDIVDLIAYCSSADSLKTLEISNCGISFIPESIAELDQLKRLDLSKNNLKTLPSAMENLNQLENLNLSWNKLKQIIYVASSFWNLKQIDVSGNEKMDLSSLFMSLAFIDELEKITLSSDDKEISFPKEIGLLNVSTIVIRNSQINKLNNAFAKNESLRELVFENCGILNEDQVVNLLKGMQNLQSIDFHYTECFFKISDLKQLTELSISHSQNFPIEALGKMDQLKVLDLRLQKLEESQKSQLKTDLPNTECLFELHKLEKEMATNHATPLGELKPNEKLIASDQPTTLVYPNTMLQIPGNAFLNQDGSMYNGPVKIQVTEMFDPVSMALEGAPMVFNGDNGDELFGSNGMFEFRAKDESGKDLQPNPNAIIEVTIKDVQPQVPGQLFAFDSIANRWNTIGVPQAVRNPADSLVKIFTDSINQVADLALISYIDIPSIVKVKMTRKRNDPSLLSFTFSGHRDFRVNDTDNPFYHTLYFKNHSQQVITKYEWKIDSLVSDETRQLFKEIEKNQNKLSKKRSKFKFQYNNYPRYVKDLTITPDFEKDHFVMSFRHKDSIIHVPVYLASKNGTKSLVEEQGKFYNKYLEKKKADDKFLAKYTKKRSKRLKLYADSRRNILINNYRRKVTPPQFMGRSQEQLKFGLTGFGMINCDYFDRNKPQQYYALTRVNDEKGQSIAVPSDVKVLLMTSNSYLQTKRTNIPYYTKNTSMILFEYGEDKLAVVHVDRVGGNFSFITKTIDTKDQTPEQIHAKIFNL